MLYCIMYERESMEEKDLTSCEEKLTQAVEKYSYLSADFENYRKRVEKEKLQWAFTAQNRVVVDLLDIVDNFERAYADISSSSHPEVVQRFSVLELIHKSISKFLSQYDITPMSTMTHFDPEMHEAVAQVSDTGKEPGTIISVLKKGYMRKGTILRPAQVSVAQ